MYGSRFFDPDGRVLLDEGPGVELNFLVYLRTWPVGVKRKVLVVIEFRV